MNEELSQKAKIKVAYMDGLINKEEMKRLLKEEESKGFEPCSPKDEPGFYENENLSKEQKEDLM